MTLPLALIPWIELQFLKVTSEGLVPNSNGFVYFFEAGSTTVAQDTYTDQDQSVANQNPIQLDADGKPPSPIFLLPTGYTVQVKDEDGALLYQRDFVEDVGQTFLAQQGQIQTQGTETSSTPYDVQDTDNLITVTGANSPFVVQLPAAADRGVQLIVKNKSSGTVNITPDGTDTIEGVAAAFAIAAGSSPTFPTVILLPDGVSNWVIAASHGL